MIKLQQHLRSMIYCLILVYPVFSSSCMAYSRELTKEEKAILDSLANSCRCRVDVYYDDTHIVNDQEYDSYTISIATLGKGFCEQDSAALVQYSKSLAHRISPVIPGNAPKKYITVSFETRMQTSFDSYDISCQKSIVISTSNIDSTLFANETPATRVRRESDTPFLN